MDFGQSNFLSSSRGGVGWGIGRGDERGTQRERSGEFLPPLLKLMGNVTGK